MLNHIVILGRLTRDPELRSTGSGVNVCNFTVAVDRDYTAPNKEKETDFIDCVAWRKSGEFVNKYFRKGSMIAVSGRLEIRKWTDKDGNPRRSAEVNADNVYFGGSKSDSEHGSYGGAQSAPYSAGGFPETEAMINRYSAPVAADDYAMLTDDDAQLPF
jgi:single-strand DNA-binding protein